MPRTSGGQLVPQKEAFRDTSALLKRMEGQFAAALPKHMDAGQFIRMAMTTMQRVPKLLECTQVSLLGGLIECAQAGLAPNSATGEAYLIPYKDNRRGVTVATLIIGYQGLMKLAYRSGLVSSIYGDVVYEKDTYDFGQGDNPFVKHKRTPHAEPGPIVAAYAIAKMKDGATVIKWMWSHEIEKVRERSMAKNNGPWVTDWDSMAIKTCIRRLMKFVPKTPELERAMVFSEAEEAGMDQEFVIDLGADGETTVVDAATGEVVKEKPKKAASLKEAMGNAPA